VITSTCSTIFLRLTATSIVNSARARDLRASSSASVGVISYIWQSRSAVLTQVHGQHGHEQLREPLLQLFRREKYVENVSLQHTERALSRGVRIVVGPLRDLQSVSEWRVHSNGTCSVDGSSSPSRLRCMEGRAVCGMVRSLATGLEIGEASGAKNRIAFSEPDQG
jgi:hypothetical protein